MTVILLCEDAAQRKEAETMLQIQAVQCKAFPTAGRSSPTSEADRI